MLPSRRVVIAFAVSLFLHGVIFSVLALTSQIAPATPRQQEEIADEPLEVVFQAAPPERAVEKMAFRVEEKEKEAQPLAMQMEIAVERTQLDPDHLKKSEKAPENAEFLASHHSLPGKAAKPQVTAALPRPTPVSPGQAPSFRTALPVPSTEAAPPQENKSEGEEEEGGVAAIGAWKKAVANAIGSRWDQFRKSKLDLLAVGSVRMKFAIDEHGRATDVRIASNTAGPANASYAARSIAEAEIPPIPPERLARLPGGRVEVEFTFTIYPAH